MRKIVASVFLIIFCLPISATALTWGELEGQIKDTLESLHLGRHYIETKYSSGKLELTGYVSTLDEKERVVHSLAQLKGVKEIDDKIEIKEGLRGGSLEDDALRKAALEAVKDLKGLGSYEIDLQSENGHLFLTGTVASDKDRTRIAKAVQMAAGAKGVENRLLVAPPLPDNEIEDHVWTALKKESDLDTSDITVAVKDGVVTISGEKPSHRTIDRILSIANMADGVKEVKSNMRLSK